MLMTLTPKLALKKNREDLSYNEQRQKITQEISEILQSCTQLLLPTSHYYLRKQKNIYIFLNSMREKSMQN